MLPEVSMGIRRNPGRGFSRIEVLVSTSLSVGRSSGPGGHPRFGGGNRTILCYGGTKWQTQLTWLFGSPGLTEGQGGVAGAEIPDAFLGGVQGTTPLMGGMAGALLGPTSGSGTFGERSPARLIVQLEPKNLTSSAVYHLAFCESNL